MACAGAAVSFKSNRLEVLVLDGSTVSPFKSYVRQERGEKAALSSHLAKCLQLPASRRLKANGEMFFAARATLTISFFGRRSSFSPHGRDFSRVLYGVFLAGRDSIHLEFDVIPQ